MVVKLGLGFIKNSFTHQAFYMVLKKPKSCILLVQFHRHCQSVGKVFIRSHITCNKGH